MWREAIHSKHSPKLMEDLQNGQTMMNDEGDGEVKLKVLA
jgi:hypothetical protein